MLPVWLISAWLLAEVWRTAVTCACVTAVGLEWNSSLAAALQCLPDQARSCVSRDGLARSDDCML